MSEQELAQGFGFNLTAVPVLAYRSCNEPLKTAASTSEAREHQNASNPVDGDRVPRTLVRNRSDVGKQETRGGSQSLCGKPGRTGVRQGKRGAAGEHGCSLAAPDSFPVPVLAEPDVKLTLQSPKLASEGEARESTTEVGEKPSKDVYSHADAKDSRGGETPLGGDELHRDPFFSSKHKLKEIWRPRRRSILLMGGDF